ncbi:ATP-binding protein [Haloactinopolyspora alba]|uniref:ATP-binding protein n=1 Tax=Haloactinopolyspora alba TaxID=648780 RepID=UPI0013EC309D|nr:ATP-binding protein [Haloactinopolyspora alba]
MNHAAPTDGAGAIELTSTVGSVPRARHHIAESLHGAGLTPVVVENALIVVTELVTNAVLHARPLNGGTAPGGVSLRWTVVGETVMIDVTDGGGAEHPRLQQPATAEDAGRGLAIVDAVALEWGVRTEPAAVTVHAVVGPWEPDAPRPA